MIRFAFYLVILTGLVTQAPHLHADQVQERQQEFLRFINLFDSATSPDEFRESAKILEAMVADGICNGAIFYNLGNAYYRAGEFGRAILNYRKAKPFRPRDKLLEANLQQALLSAPGKLSQANKPWWLHVMFWTGLVSYPHRVWMTLACFAAAPALAFTAVVLRRRGVLLVAGGVTALGVLFAVDTVLNSPERENAGRAVITGETMARKGIGKDYEAAFDAPLKDGRV